MTEKHVYLRSYVMICKQALQIIMDSEGCRLAKYRTYLGSGRYEQFWTIGYGHVIQLDEDYDLLTKEQAVELLQEDIHLFEEGVDKLITVPINENQRGALVSLAYNIGLGNLKKSHIVKLINQGHPESVDSYWLAHNKASGKVLSGLTTRRQRELELFKKEV